MPRNGFVVTPDISIRPSRLLAAALIVLYATATGVIAAAAPPAWAALTVPVLMASLAREWHRHLGSGAIRRVRRTEDGRWRLTDARGRVVTAQLRGDSFVTPWLTVLGFGRGLRRRSVVLLPDSADRVTRRRLRVAIHGETPG